MDMINPDFTTPKWLSSRNPYVHQVIIICFLVDAMVSNHCEGHAKTVPIEPHTDHDGIFPSKNVHPVYLIPNVIYLCDGQNIQGDSLDLCQLL